MQATAGTISVSGTGSVEAVPDLALVTMGVECRADTVEAAYSRAGTSSAAVAAAFQRQGVATSDIQTAGLSVRADLVWREGQGQSVTGYVAATTLTVRLRAVDSAAAVISDAVAAGGNEARLNGLELTLADDSAVRARARKAAWLDALNTATQFAALAAVRLGRVLSITDSQAPQGPLPLAQIERTSAVEAMTIEGGRTAVQSTITVVWAIMDDADGAA